MKKKKQIKNFFIISTRPYFRNLFFNLKLFGKGLLKSENLFFLKFSSFSKFGSFMFFLISQNIFFNKEYVFNIGSIIGYEFFNEFLKRFKFFSMGIQYAWLVNFAIEGYHFRAFLTKIKSLRKFVIIFHLGFFYNVMLIFPKHVKIYWKKRSFNLRSAFLLELIMITTYIRMIRNLFPYKVKGFVYDNLIFSKASDYERELFYIKPGKKSKLR